MKKNINITGYIDVAERKIELDKNGLSVPYLMMVITGLIQLLYNCMDEGDRDKAKDILNDISDNPTEELKSQMEAVQLATLLRGLKDLGLVGSEEKEDKVN